MKIGNRQLAEGNRKKAKFLLAALCAMLFALCSAAQARQHVNIPRVGVLLALPHDAIADRIGAFRRGLRERGYVEGKTLVVDFRYADGKFDQLPRLAAELVGLKVIVIATGGPSHSPR